MKQNLWGDYDTMGSVFIEKDISPYKGSKNWLINGHSSKTKVWNFTFMKKYANKNYFNQHNTFIVEDGNGYHTYQVVSFAEYDLSLGEDNLYLGWFNNKFESIEEVVNMFKNTDPYVLQRNNEFNYKGQQIITLVTCNMEKKDARYVLMGVEK